MYLASRRIPAVCEAARCRHAVGIPSTECNEVPQLAFAAYAPIAGRCCWVVRRLFYSILSFFPSFPCCFFFSFNEDHTVSFTTKKKGHF